MTTSDMIRELCDRMNISLGILMDALMASLQAILRL